MESSEVERDECAGAVHHELSRLPEKYRAPIVLCHMEGLTHDEAAACLGWPVGTVRSRLSRGRDSLRRRLSRHGLSAPAVIGPLDAWLAGDQEALAATAKTISGNLVAQVVKLASHAAAGRSAAITSSQATSLALAYGVLNMLMLKKVAVVAALVLSIGTITIGGGVALVRSSSAQDSQSKAISSEKGIASPPDTQDKTVGPADVDRRFQDLLALATQSYDYKLKRYVAGQPISLDQLIQACDQLENIERRAAKSSSQQIAVRERALDRLKRVETIAEANVKSGRGDAGELVEFTLRRMQMKIDQDSAGKEEIDSAVILQRLKELERKVEQFEKRFPAPLGRN